MIRRVLPPLALLLALLPCCAEEGEPPPSCEAVWEAVARTAYAQEYTLFAGPPVCPQRFTTRDTDPVDPSVACSLEGQEVRRETSGDCIIQRPRATCFLDGKPVFSDTATIHASRSLPPTVVADYVLQYPGEARACSYSVSFQPL